MSTIELKNKIVSKLNSIEDSSVLETVLNYIENLKDSYKNGNLSTKQLNELDRRRENYLAGKLNSLEEIVAFSIDGKPISKKEYIKRNEQAVDSYKKGNYKTQKEILEKYKKSI